MPGGVYSDEYCEDKLNSSWYCRDMETTNPNTHCNYSLTLCQTIHHEGVYSEDGE